MRTCTAATAALGTWLAAWGTAAALGGTIEPLDTTAPGLCSPGEATFADLCSPRESTFAGPSSGLWTEPSERPSAAAYAMDCGAGGMGELAALAAPLPDPEPEGALIPEPGSAMLLLAGLAGLTVGRRTQGRR